MLKKSCRNCINCFETDGGVLVCRHYDQYFGLLIYDNICSNWSDNPRSKDKTTRNTRNMRQYTDDFMTFFDV